MEKINRPRGGIYRAILVLGLAFLGYLAYLSRDALQETIATVSAPEFTLAIVLLVLANVSAALLFTSMLSRSAPDAATYRRVGGVFLMTQLGKYVPGRLWGLVAQITWLRYAKSTGRLVAVNVELALIVLLTTAGVGGALLIEHWCGSAAGIIALIVAFATTALMAQRELLLRAFKHGMAQVSFLKKYRPLGDASLEFSRPKWAMVSALAGFWIMYLTGWWVLVATLPGVSEVGAGLIVACLSLSYVVGLASMLPAGLGARELALVILAPISGVPLDMMAMVAIISRTALILVDGICSLIGFVATRTPQRSPYE